MPRPTPALLAAVVTSFSGCMAHGAPFAQAKATDGRPGQAILYVYREHAMPSAWGATVSIDGETMTSLNERGFTWAYVRPGKRQLKGAWSPISGQSSTTLELEVAEGRTYYVDLTGDVRLNGIWAGYYDWTIGSGMHEVKPEFAEALLNTCCSFQRPEREAY